MICTKRKYRCTYFVTEKTTIYDTITIYMICTKRKCRTYFVTEKKTIYDTITIHMICTKRKYRCTYFVTEKKKLL